MNSNDLGKRMKRYEKQESGRRLLPLLPVIARIDGKNFSQFTKCLARPFDSRLSNLMIKTTEYLLAQSDALCGFTQSDEITLLLHSSDIKRPIFFDGKIQKINSVLSSMATAYFNTQKQAQIPEKSDTLAIFDSRVWTVPNQEEAANLFLWRERDATKNSVSMAAREWYSHKELLSKSAKQMQLMLLDKNVNWNDYPSFFKRGTFIRRTDTGISPIEMPPFDQVSNRADVLFDQVMPKSYR